MTRAESGMVETPSEGPPSFHFEVLSQPQRELLVALGPIAEEAGFYLVGGTGLALSLGHRKSVDYDWFRAEPFSPLDLVKRLKRLSDHVDVRKVAEGTLHATLSGVACSFLRYDYPLLASPTECPDPRFHIASLEDIAAMKLSALLQRGERKDFIDVVALLRRTDGLAPLLSHFERKFGFDGTASLLRGLCYFEDAEDSSDPATLWPRLDWDSVKQELKEAVRRFVGPA